MQGTLRRIVAVLVLALSAGVSATLPIADARAEIAALAGTAHVEDSGASRCPPTHDDVACQLCRVLRLDAVPRSSTAVELDAALAEGPSQRGTSWRPTTQVALSASPRAPPLG